MFPVTMEDMRMAEGYAYGSGRAARIVREGCGMFSATTGDGVPVIVVVVDADDWSVDGDEIRDAAEEAAAHMLPTCKESGRVEVDLIEVVAGGKPLHTQHVHEFML